MSSHFLAQYLLVFLLVYADFTFSKVHYIKPSVDGPCPQNSSCLTLSQFAAKSSYNETDISLLFLSGNHTLSRKLLLSDSNNFSMTKDGLDNEIVFVHCPTHMGRFKISKSNHVSIRDLHFIGCGSNSVSQVKQLTITDSTFQSVEDKGTVLVLNKISIAHIVRSSFLLNTLQYHATTKFVYSSKQMRDYVYLQQNKPSGVLYSAFSNVSIISSKFMQNTADIGAALVAHNSSLYLARNTYSYNHANFGGVMVTSGSTIDIDESTFMNNVAHQNAGVMVTYNDTFTISSTTFANNLADGFYNLGGVMVTFDDSSFTVINSTFTNNSAKGGTGGVMSTFDDSSFTIFNSIFNNNSASDGGAMNTYDDSSFTITNSAFTNNRAVGSGYEGFGGVMYTDGHSSFIITDSTFSNNSGTYGGVMKTWGDSAFTITNSTFTNNRAESDGGVMIISDSSFTITNSTFSNNSAIYGGVMETSGHFSLFVISNSTFNNNRAVHGGVTSTPLGSSFTITDTTFTNNRADSEGGVIRTSNEAALNITGSTFTNNSAAYGGVVNMDGYSSLNISNSMFLNNKATVNGGVILSSSRSILNVDNSNFSLNGVLNQRGINSSSVFNQGGIMFIVQCSTHITNCTFDQNNGSLYTFSSNLTFSGYIKFVESTELHIPVNVLSRSQEGGAITSFQSTVVFSRESTVLFLNNRASHGGAVLAIESTITIYGKTIIANNVATIANSIGGGISLKQSQLEIKGNCQIVNNSAVRGGGIHASSSTIAVYKPAHLQFINNTAELGGGIYLEVNPKLYILKNKLPYNGNSYFVSFTDNDADYGGAVYVADVTNSGACSPDNECFIQSLALYPNENKPKTVNFFFGGNSASEQGSNLFGGLLDRCIPSPFAEVYQKQSMYYYSGVSYLGNISNYINLDSISSQPVRVCFCNSHMEHEQDCSHKPRTIRVEKGKAFNVSLVAVDQVNHTVDANITVYLSSSDGGFGEGQQIQSVERNCTNLTFNVFSPHNFETINLYPDGPCGSAAISSSHVTVQFIDCTCPVGFQPHSNSQSSTSCKCYCDSALSPYITDCNVTTTSVLRKGTNSWISYINDTDPPGYVINPNCPFDFCRSQTENVNINFNLPKGADSQCAYNRTGVLCGACKDNLSLSLASSRCLPCRTNWLAMLVVILVAAAIAGIMLVTALLALNMTVSVGLINGFIFYANIMSAGSAIFFPSSKPSFPSVFVAWLNLDIGIDVCFIDGLDAYTKTWLQIAFPVYIISLVVIVIIVSEYSSRFARLIGKRDPISTLATLILLSYAKLLSITITALSPAVLHYPDGKQETVWLPDGNVKFFQGKHIPLALVALLIIIIGLPYTILLFLWQCIVRAPKLKVFKWTRNTKLNVFIASHHVPHNSKYRYWTGLLLLVRVVLYITASVTVSANPQTFPLITNVLVGGLFLFKGVFGLRVYKNSFVDIVDTVLYVNLLVLSVFTLYDFKANITKQTAVAYTSTITTLILFIGVICYHVTLLIKKKQPPDELNEHLLTPVQPDNAEMTEVTYSVIELPKPNQDQPQADKDSDEEEITEDHRIITPPYNDEY